MARRRKNGNGKSSVFDATRVKGFCRVQIVEKDPKTGKMTKIVGDSGWSGPNQVVNLGFEEYLVRTLGVMSGSRQVRYVALGTGGAPGATDTSLTGEIMASTQRTTVQANIVASQTQRFLATFASSDSFLTAASNLSNVGLFHSTEAGMTIFAGNTYTSSSCDTNQDVNVTYEIRFS